MAVSVQAKRSKEVSIKLSKFFKFVFFVTIPIILVILSFAISLHYSRLNLEIQIQKEAFKRETLELNRKIININKNIEALMVGSETLK
ncbi:MULTISPECIES: hypothetical protein [unclassified Thermosipho (in: thermotogales)]|uniref:hypothetical protein n=1 Tax=unclassified Thermosipho (in: thermotogales) TaxID=2676525 RepID=UPI0009850304|nr:MULTISPECIES: hypothetical protein [unclassified Thermosipho (in: thermotogales)]MBT1248729.1 hypothetical protein [Thermosipho sp. 1244]OOC47656.1 hypothetical protein XO09_00065 [Thermosipho sp. 1223]